MKRQFGAVLLTLVGMVSWAMAAEEGNREGYRQYTAGREATLVRMIDSPAT